MKVLVLAPHPDDEALGCGGAIRKHVLDGDSVHVVYLTAGELGCPGEDPMETAQRRRADAEKCCAELGVQRASFFAYPDGGLSQSSELTGHLVQLFRELAPDLIYAPHPGESHPDHAVTGRIVWTEGANVAPVRLYEIWTPLQKVDLCLDITAVAGAKRSAIRCHRTQLWSGFDTAVLALNQYRGIMHGPHMLYAEAFEVRS